MAKCSDLLRQARSNPAGLRFTELLRLAECYGFELDRQKGSHRIYRHSSGRGITLQPWRNNMAASYQVKKLIVRIDEIMDEGL